MFSLTGRKRLLSKRFGGKKRGQGNFQNKNLNDENQIIQIRNIGQTLNSFLNLINK